MEGDKGGVEAGLSGAHPRHQLRQVSDRDPNLQKSQAEWCGVVLTAISWLIVLLTFPFSFFVCLQIVQEYERAVIFRLGRLLSGDAKGPGLFFILPCVETFRKVDLRLVSFDVPPQEILTKDSVTVSVDAVVYFRISNATISITNVEDASRSTRLLAQITLRNILGMKTLSEILADRESISHNMQETLDEATEPWGVKVERVEVKDVRLPVNMQRAMAAEAEAVREARAKVIAAEGEQKASRALKDAAEVLTESPAAIQLRYLQTLNTISAERNSTIIFPVPVDLISNFLNRGPNNGQSGPGGATRRKPSIPSKPALPPPPAETGSSTSTPKTSRVELFSGTKTVAPASTEHRSATSRIAAEQIVLHDEINSDTEPLVKLSSDV